jgi:long-chain acyl-CoA synthetase
MILSNLAHMVLQRAEGYPNRPALKWKEGEQWISMNYGEMCQQVKALASALYDQNIRPGDRVGIWANNQTSWTLFDMAILSLRAVCVPIYATNSLEQTQELIADAGLKLLYIAGETPIKSLSKAEALPPCLEGLILMVPSEAPKGITLPVIAFNEMLHHTAPKSTHDALRTLQDDANMDELASIIYTSGTTGQPKGVMLSHSNFEHQHRVVCEYFDVGKGDRSLCFLPLSHVYERAWTWHVLACGAENAYLEDPRNVAVALEEVQPNIMVSVPRLYEKIHSLIFEKLEDAPEARQKIFHWATGIGKQVSELTLAKKRIPFGLKAKHAVAHKLVFSKIQAKMGGPKKFLSSGGAPLSAEVAAFFHSVGLLICEGFGLTETSPIITCNRPQAVKFGSVGQLVPDCEVRINEDTGEIETRGKNLFKGYWNKPESTDRAFTRDGWFKTGDIGQMDSEGFLSITGRIKELIITSGGKNIAPNRIEAIVARDGFIEQIAAVGEGQKCVAALVVPAFEKLENWAKSQGLKFDCRESLVRLPEVLQLFRQRIQEQSSGLGKHEMVKAFVLLPEMFSEATGTMTPTLKLKRHAIARQYELLIAQMYSRFEEAGLHLNKELTALGGHFLSKPGKI